MRTRVRNPYDRVWSALADLRAHEGLGVTVEAIRAKAGVTQREVVVELQAMRNRNAVTWRDAQLSGDTLVRFIYGRGASRPGQAAPRRW